MFFTTTTFLTKCPNVDAYKKQHKNYAAAKEISEETDVLSSGSLIT